LQAEIYIPSRAIGFVKPGQEVRLLYDAFPYQRFGAYRGRVVAASSSKNPWASSTRLSISRCSTFISIASPISRSRPKKRD
jgi:hypothetical protein